MSVSVTDHIRLNEQDDQLHIRSVQLALNVITPLKSRTGSIIEERLAELYERLDQGIDPAKHRELTAANQDLLTSGDSDYIPPSNGNAQIAESRLGVSPDLEDPFTATGVVESLSPTQAPQEAESSPTSYLSRSVPRFKVAKPDTQQQYQSQASNWVWILSQLLKTDLKRLGLDPDELDEIRIYLIKVEAGKFDKLELLSQLPDSLSPEAQATIFEDIRRIAAGYVAIMTVELFKNQSEQEEDVKQFLEIPRSLSSAFYGIPLVDFDPAKILENLDKAV